MLVEYFTVKSVYDRFKKREAFADAPVLNDIKAPVISAVTAPATTTTTATTATATATAPATATEEKKSMGIVGLLIFLGIFIALGIWAVLLSWNSNTLAGWGGGAKVFFAIVAFFANQTYLISHLLHKADLLGVIGRLTNQY